MIEYYLWLQAYSMYVLGRVGIILYQRIICFHLKRSQIFLIWLICPIWCAASESRHRATLSCDVCTLHVDLLVFLAFPFSSTQQQHLCTMVKGAKWYWAGDSKGTQDAWVEYSPAVCHYFFSFLSLLSLPPLLSTRSSQLTFFLA